MAASASRAIYESNTRSETTLTAGAGQGEVLQHRVPQHRVPHAYCHPLALPSISEPRPSSPRQHIPAQEPLGSFRNGGTSPCQAHTQVTLMPNCQALSLCSCLLGSLPGTGSALHGSGYTRLARAASSWPKTAAVLECSVFCHGRGWPEPPL